MKNINKTTVQHYFDKTALNYKNDFEQGIINSLLEVCEIKSDSYILEAGSGTSDFTLLLLKKIGKEGNIICNDISPKMLEVAKHKISDPKVSFLNGDISSISFASLKVNKVICFNMFPHIVDKSKFFQNIFINLSSGGELIICHDKNRASIIGLHKSHKVPAVFSDFPETNIIVAEMKSAGFMVTKVKDDDYYFVRGNRP